MNAKSQTSKETYKQQLQRIARAMATARTAEVYNDLEPGSQPELMKYFVDGNLDKRLEKLEKQLELVKESLGEDFEPWAIEFIKELPLGAYDSGQFDGEKFLIWLERSKSLSLEQQDHVVCQRARHAIEAMGRKHHLAHVQFQDLASMASQLSGELDANLSLRVHLNPIRVWTRFATKSLLDDDAEVPADVLFFAVRNETSTAILESEGRLIVQELAELQPITLASWSAISDHGDRNELTELCVDLAEMSLVAFS